MLIGVEEEEEESMMGVGVALGTSPGLTKMVVVS